MLSYSLAIWLTLAYFSMHLSTALFIPRGISTIVSILPPSTSTAIVTNTKVVTVYPTTSVLSIQRVVTSSSIVTSTAVVVQTEVVTSTAVSSTTSIAPAPPVSSAPPVSPAPQAATLPIQGVCSTTAQPQACTIDPRLGTLYTCCRPPSSSNSTLPYIQVCLQNNATSPTSGIWADMSMPQAICAPDCSGEEGTWSCPSGGSLKKCGAGKLAEDMGGRCGVIGQN